MDAGPVPEPVGVAQGLNPPETFPQSFELIGAELGDALAMADPFARVDRRTVREGHGSTVGRPTRCRQLLLLKTQMLSQKNALIAWIRSASPVPRRRSSPPPHRGCRPSWRRSRNGRRR